MKKFKKNDPLDEEISTNSEVHYDIILKARYKWMIENYTNKSRGQKLKVGDKIESPSFKVGSNDELEFKMQIFPMGHTEKDSSYLVVGLVLVVSKEPKVKLQISYNLMNRKNRELSISYETEVIDVVIGQVCGLKRLTKSESLCVKHSGFLKDDKLILICDINTVLSKTNRNKIKVVNDLEMLLDSENYSDLNLIVADQKFKVHKYILAARSSVFAAMFRHDMKEKNENVVKIIDITPAVMKELLLFIYTGEVKHLDSSAKELLAAADRYDLKDLKKLCENFLSKNLSVNNVVETLNFAELHSSIKLKEQALGFLVTHIKEVVNTKAFKTMGDTQSPLMAQIIKKLAAQKN